MKYYFPFRLREVKTFTTPTGPEFSKALPVAVQFGDSLLSFRAPKHSPDSKVKREMLAPACVDLDSKSTYNQNFSLGDWREGYFFSRFWRFVGPLFTGAIADLQMVIRVSQFASGTLDGSLFSGEFFQQAVMSRLTLEFGEKKFMGKPDWAGPVNWSPHASFPVPLVKYDLVPVHNDYPITEAVFPIRKDTLITIRFYQGQHMDGNLEAKDALIDRVPMMELSNLILNSVTLKLSEQLQLEVSHANSNCSEVKLDENVAILNWE